MCVHISHHRHPYPHHPYPQHHIVSRWPALTTPLTPPPYGHSHPVCPTSPLLLGLMRCLSSHRILGFHFTPLSPFPPHNSFDPVLSLLCTFVSTPLYPSLVSPHFAHSRWLCLGSVRRLSYRDHFQLPQTMESKAPTCAEDGGEFIPGHDACGHTTSLTHLSLKPCSIREMTFAH